MQSKRSRTTLTRDDADPEHTGLDYSEIELDSGPHLFPSGWDHYKLRIEHRARFEANGKLLPCPCSQHVCYDIIGLWNAARNDHIRLPWLQDNPVRDLASF